MHPALGFTRTVGNPALGFTRTVGNPALGFTRTVENPALGFTQTVGNPAPGFTRTVGNPALGFTRTVGNRIMCCHSLAGKPETNDSKISIFSCKCKCTNIQSQRFTVRYFLNIRRNPSTEKCLLLCYYEHLSDIQYFLS